MMFRVWLSSFVVKTVCMAGCSSHLHKPLQLLGLLLPSLGTVWLVCLVSGLMSGLQLPWCCEVEPSACVRWLPRFPGFPVFGFRFPVHVGMVACIGRALSLVKQVAPYVSGSECSGAAYVGHRHPAAVWHGADLITPCLICWMVLVRPVRPVPFAWSPERVQSISLRSGLLRLHLLVYIRERIEEALHPFTFTHSSDRSTKCLVCGRTKY